MTRKSSEQKVGGTGILTTNLAVAEKSCPGSLGGRPKTRAWSPDFFLRFSLGCWTSSKLTTCLVAIKKIRGGKTLKFPRHEGEEGDPPEGVYHALCRVEHDRELNHYITKVSIGVVLHHSIDEWYSFDALGKPGNTVTRTEEDGLASGQCFEQCFAVFVNAACVALKEDVVDVSKSLHRVVENRKSAVGARTRGRAGKL